MGASVLGIAAFTMVSPTSPGAWLELFVQAVRDNGLDAGRALFAEDVVGYGVITARMVGLDDLLTDQWQPTWRRVATWNVTGIDVRTCADDLAVVGFCWRRVNNDDAEVVNGRATVVLERHGKRWLCVHSHFSASPP